MDYPFIPNIGCTENKISTLWDNFVPQGNKMEDIIKRNNVRVVGSGKSMIFAHGFGCDQNMWRSVSPAFEEKYEVVLFDLVGAGKSDTHAYNIEKYSDLNGYAGDLLEVLDALSLKDVIFVGHSVSSMIGLLAAVKAPGLFSEMIFVSPSPCYINDGKDYVGGFERRDINDLLELMDKNYIGWANFLAPVVMQNPGDAGLTEELNASFCSTDPVIARQFAEVTFLSDNRGDLKKLTIPTLLLQCSDDVIAPVTVGKYMQGQIKNSKLVVMSATGHCPHMSAPAETISCIKNYLLSLNR